MQRPGQTEATKRPRKIAFGAGALEETDTFGYMEDYVTEDGHNLEAFAYEIASDEEHDAMPPRYQGCHPCIVLWGQNFPPASYAMLFPAPTMSCRHLAEALDELQSSDVNRDVCL